MTLHVNDHFFRDGEPDSLLYVLGAYHVSGRLDRKRKGVILESPRKELVEIVKKELNSEHKIWQYPGKKSFQLEIQGAPNLYRSLVEYGLEIPRTQRPFPEYLAETDSSEPGLRDFVRSIVDAKANFFSNDGVYSMHVYFRNPQFMDKLLAILTRFTQIKGGSYRFDRLTFGINDTMRIGDFIYRDFERIQERQLYVPSVRQNIYSDRNVGRERIAAAAK